MSPVVSKALINNTFKTKGDSFFANNEFKEAVKNKTDKAFNAFLIEIMRKFTIYLVFAIKNGVN